MKSMKARRKSFISAMLVVAMTMALTFALISCGNGGTDDTAKDDIKGGIVLETDEDGEAVAVATDEDGNKVVYETDKSGNVKESRKSKDTPKSAGDADRGKSEAGAKSTERTEAKSTAAKATTTATQARQVCYISIDGYCSGKAVALQGGDTAYSILTRSGASVSGSGSYVKGINGLFEFDKGPQSGWKYSVNGYTPNVGAGSYGVGAGDSISWYYVTSY